MAGATVLGPCTCPLCNSQRASARLSSKGLAYIVCEGCNMQLFARSGKSDELARARITAAPAGDPTPAPTPQLPAPAPAQHAPAPAGWGLPKW